MLCRQGRQKDACQLFRLGVIFGCEGRRSPTFSTEVQYQTFDRHRE